eukprot:14040143-Ditylum_brightwellii.AAC.1
MTPFDGSYLASNCGLTQSSRLALGGELQSSLQLLQRELSSENPKMGCVLDFLKLFHYIEHYIIIEDVNVVTRQVDGVVGSFIEKQKSLIKAEMERGTFSKYGFGAANISSIKAALLHLESLEDSYPDKIGSGNIKHCIKEDLLKLQEAVQISPGNCFDGIHHQLGKMKAWADGFPEFSHLYRTSFEHLGKRMLFMHTNQQLVVFNQWLAHGAQHPSQKWNWLLSTMIIYKI